MVLKTQTSCANGDFETGTFANYTGARGEFGLMDANCTWTWVGGSSCALHSYDFCPVSLPTSDISIVTQGTDPVVPFINRVHRGDYAAKINDEEVLFDVDKLIRVFQFDPANPQVDFWYALVMENPADHDNQQPFFEVRILLNGVEVTCDTEFCIEADANDVGNFEAIIYNHEIVVYKDWTCATIDVSCLGLSEGEEFTVEFLASDCGQGAHFGYAYIDDICLGCGDFFDGEVTLDPLINCTINFPQQIRGSYLPPFDENNTATLLDVVLEVYQNGVLQTVINNGLINTGNQTFSFELNQNNFNFEGCFDVYAVATFDLNGEIRTVRSGSIIPNDLNQITGNYETDNDFCTDFNDCFDNELNLDPIGPWLCEFSNSSLWKCGFAYHWRTASKY